MNLFKIQNELIADRTADAWFRINIAGPWFHYRWQWGTGGGEGFSYVIGEHTHHAVSREEPSLTVSWGMEVRDDDDLDFEWSRKFVNPTVRPFWVDFFWNNAVVDRVELCRIDGAHGVIPFPSYAMEVTHFEVAVAGLVHDLERGENSDRPGRYLDIIGARIVGDHDREGAGSPTS